MVVTHENLASLLAFHLSELVEPAARRAGRRVRAALVAALSFDASWDVMVCLLLGHELHVLDDDVAATRARWSAMSVSTGWT